MRARIAKGYNAVLEKMLAQPKVLVIVGDAEARDAVIAAASRVIGLAPDAIHLEHHTVFQYQPVYGTWLAVVQSGRGPIAPGGSALTADSVIRQVKPDSVIGVGRTTGLDPAWGEAGDIVVSSQLRLAGNDFQPTAQTREDIIGDNAHPSVRLLDKFQAATVDWVGPKVWCNPIVSAGVPINTPQRRETAHRAFPDAIAAETDGAGIYVAGQKARVDWIIIGTMDAPIAAAADFLMHVVKGGLNGTRGPL